MPFTEKKYRKATFGGGCFWCMQPPFEKVPGVISVAAGYTGGGKPHPSYEEVSGGLTGHIEAVDITYDPARVSYEGLLEIFWANIDPTQAGGQFNDIGPQYQTAIFIHDDEQKRLASLSMKQLEISGLYKAPLQTRILPAGEFYAAEDYHQQYYKKNPAHYNMYKTASGREAHICRMSRQRKKGRQPPA